MESSPPPEKTLMRETSEDGTVNFFSRFSTIKVEYEKENRETLQKSRNSSFRIPQASFLKSKEEIVVNLKSTLAQENLDDVYVEVLCLLFPTQKAREDKTSKPLINYLQKVFDYDDATHTALFKKAASKDLGVIELHLEIIEGRNLPSKDANGLSDPFCTLFLTHKNFSKRTQIMSETLNPKWKETFKFTIKDMENDFLQIDVWDYDPEERMRDKFKRLRAVKCMNAMGNAWREISHGRSSTQEFIGTIKIPMKELSVETVEKWVALVNPEGQGEIYLIMALGVNKEMSSAIDLYRTVVQVLIGHEVSAKPTMVPFHWENQSEALGGWSAYLQRQLKNGWGLKPNDVLLANWLAYCKMHVVFPISGAIFPPLIKQLFTLLQKSYYTTDQVSLAWQGAQDLIIFSASFVEKIHEFFPCNVTTGQLHYVLKALKELRGLTAPQLPNSVRASLVEHTILHDVQHALEKGAQTFVEGACRTCGIALDCQEFKKLPMIQQIEKLRKLGQILNDDLARGREAVEKDFNEILGIDYHGITYTVYDKQFGELVEPLVSKFCSCLGSVFESAGVKGEGNVGGESNTTPTDDCESSAQFFFQLYLCVKQFSDDKLRANSCTQWVIASSFHNWFFPGLTHMFDILGLKWVEWMRKAILKDCNSPEIEQDLTKYKEVYYTSSSARDTIGIFYDIQRFWEILAWPNEQQSLKIASKIIRELCGYSVSYAELVSQNFLASDKNEVGKDYHVSKRMCRFINNIEYVGFYTRKIASNLNAEKMASAEVRDSFKEKQSEIQRSGLEGVIEELLRDMASKMSPVGESLISGVMELPEEDGEESNKKLDAILNKVITYYRTNLDTLADNLLLEFYETATAFIWNETINSFRKIIAIALKEEKSWKRFKRLKKILKHLKGFFEVNLLHHVPKNAASLLSTPKTIELMTSLENYASSTSIIKCKYFQRRFQRQKEKKSDYGVVKMRFYFDEIKSSLQIEILNAQSLQASDSNGLSDPYADIQLVPLEMFPGIQKMTTKVHNANLFPLFEEEFSTGLKPEWIKSDGFVRVRIYDYDRFSRDEFLGEVFFPLAEIERSECGKSLKEIPYVLSSLTKPLDSDIEFLEGNLGLRTNDKEAIRFLKSETWNK